MEDSHGLFAPLARRANFPPSAELSDGSLVQAQQLKFAASPHLETEMAMAEHLRNRQSPGCSQRSLSEDQTTLQKIAAMGASSDSQRAVNQCDNNNLAGVGNSGVPPHLLLDALSRRWTYDEDRLIDRISAAVVQPLESRLKEFEISIRDMVNDRVQAVIKDVHTRECAVSSHRHNEAINASSAALTSDPDSLPIASLLRPYLAAAAVEAISKIKQKSHGSLLSSKPSNVRESSSLIGRHGLQDQGCQMTDVDTRSKRTPETTSSHRSCSEDLTSRALRDVLSSGGFAAASSSQQQTLQDRRQQDLYSIPKMNEEDGCMRSLSDFQIQLLATQKVFDEPESSHAEAFSSQEVAACSRKRKNGAESGNCQAEDGQLLESQIPFRSGWSEPRQRKRRPQQCSVCGLPRFTTFGHTMEGWCPVRKEWGARSKCSLCGELRAKVPGHLPDGFCPTLSQWDQSILRRHKADEAAD